MSDSIDAYIEASELKDSFFTERTKLRRMLEKAMILVRDVGENNIYPTLSRADLEQHARNVRDAVRAIADETP